MPGQRIDDVRLYVCLELLVLEDGEGVGGAVPGFDSLLMTPSATSYRQERENRIASRIADDEPMRASSLCFTCCSIAIIL